MLELFKNLIYCFKFRKKILLHKNGVQKLKDQCKTLIVFFTIVVITSLFTSGIWDIAENDNINPSILEQNLSQDVSSLKKLLTSEFNENDAETGGDAGDTIINASTINPGIYNGTITNGDQDFYTFYLYRGQIVNVSMMPYNISVNFDLTLYRIDASFLSNNLKEAGFRETIVWSIISEGFYFASVTQAIVGQEANYSLNLLVTTQNDFNSSTDAGNFINSPLEILPGDSNGSLVIESDTADYYKVMISKGQVLNVSLGFQNDTNLDLILQGISGNVIFSSEKLSSNNESIYYAFNTEGNYIIQILLTDVFDSNIIIPYNLTIILTMQNDGGFGTDAGDTFDDSLLIDVTIDPIIVGRLYKNGDLKDFYYFNITENSKIYLVLDMPQNVNFDLFLYDSDTIVASSVRVITGSSETIINFTLERGIYYISIEYTDGEALEGEYSLTAVWDLITQTTPNSGPNWSQIIPIIISAVLVPIFLITTIIFALYLFTDVKIPGISSRLDRYFSKEGKEETAKSLKYALRVRDETISSLRADLVDKDSKRAKDLETLHRLEEDQKSKDLVITKIREENNDLKTRLDNLQAVNDDLANIIDSTIRRQLSKSSKPTQKAKISAITALIWLSEERLINYINSIPLLNERYILDKSKNFILTKDFAREIVRQAYWKRVGAMHLKKIKQVKVSNLAEDTNIEINTLKIILRELVERKEIPAPIHMDRVSLLLSISEELISEVTELAQSTPIISLKEVSKSYDTTEESIKIIFERISEEGYVNGEFINDDKFVVFNLFVNAIISEASIDIAKFSEENKLMDEEEEIRILIERMIQTGELKGQFITDNIFICYNNLTDQLVNLIQTSAESIEKGDTRRVVFDLGSVVESIIKQSLMLEIQEVEKVDKLPRYHDIIESIELGKLIRAAEEEKITLPSNVELKSLNRFWAQKIKHTKPGELPYIPTIEESREFLFQANRALNKILSQSIPTKWKKIIAENLLQEKKQ